MHCSCCDKLLTEKEIVWNPDIDNWEFCVNCLDVSLDAAYSDGFSRDPEDDQYVLLDDEDDFSYDPMTTSYEEAFHD